MKHLLIFSYLSGLMIMSSACKPDDKNSKSRNEPQQLFNKNILEQQRSEQSKVLFIKEPDLAAFKVLSLFEIANRMKNSEPGQPVAKMRDQLLQQAPQIAADLHTNNCMDLALISVLLNDESYKKQILQYVETTPDIPVELWYSLNMLYRDEAIGAIIENHNNILRRELSGTITKLLSLSKSKSVSRISCYQLAEMSSQIVLLCILLGKDQYGYEYELGVEHALKALNKFGEFGDLSEDLDFAQISIYHLTMVARAMMLTGDSRALRHESWSRMSSWMVQMLLPECNKDVSDTANAVSSWCSTRSAQIADTLAEIAALTQDSLALSALKHHFKGYPSTIAGYGAALFNDLDVSFEPLTYAYFPNANWITWRNQWDASSSGIWIKGGLPDETQSHFNNGHVSIFLNGKLALLDCGLQRNDKDRLDTFYCPHIFHNVLSIDNNAPLAEPASIIVRHLNQYGGNVRVDLTQCYQQLVRYSRDVFWEANQNIRIVDDLSFKVGQNGRVFFHWNIGSHLTSDLVRKGRQFIIEGEDILMVIEANRPVIVSQQFDALPQTQPGKPPANIIMAVESLDKVFDIRITTRIFPKGSL